MEDKIFKILGDFKLKRLTIDEATDALLCLHSVSDSTFKRPSEPIFECPKCGCDTIDLPLKLTPRVDCGKPKCADCGFEFDN